jgi:superoxide dismutase, Cu-Zn family
MYVRAVGLLMIATTSAVAVAAPGLAAAQAQTPPIGASAQLVDTSGQVVAQASFREAPDQVLISLAFPDRSAFVGMHAIQIHEVGRCDPPEFSSAGGIFNPFGKQHGLKNPGGPMAGDVPSLSISPGGVSGYNTSAPLVKLGQGPASLLRPGGTSLVIFAQADDDQSQPEGNAGARIACGVIVPAGPNANDALDPLTAFLIAVLGVLVISAGIVLRRAPNIARH